jgi:hypothetical protein
MPLKTRPFVAEIKLANAIRARSACAEMSISMNCKCTQRSDESTREPVVQDEG